MFTAADFKLIQRICPTDLLQLLNLLGIDRQKMNFSGDDEFEKYADLDDAIDKKISAMLKSNSVLEGYTKLLDAGRIEFKLSETRIELLKKILANRKKILSPTSNNTLQKDFEITFNIVKPNFFQATPFALKDEFIVKKSTESRIKKILKEDENLKGFDIEKVDVSITINSGVEKPKPAESLPNKNFDDIFRVLEQVNKIFDKI